MAFLIFIGAAMVLAFLGGYVIGATKYQELVSDVEDRNAEAAALLDDLTAQRDHLQAEMAITAKLQEEKDAKAIAEIDRLGDELRNRPIRVRIAEAGNCSGSATSDAATAADSGAGSAAETYGLLPEENTRRLGTALTEVEILSAAYNSCRATLMRQTQPGYNNGN